MSFLYNHTESNWLYLTLNRADKKNSLNSDLIHELTDTFCHIDKDIKGVVLKGEGSCFCSGADLNWIHQASFQELEKLYTLFETIEACSLPVIAYVHGSIFGGGIGLLSVCDFVSAHTKTTFCFSELKLGLMPALIAPFILKACPQLKTHMLMSRPFHVDVAKQHHLVHFVGSEKECQDWQNKLIQHLNSLNLKAFSETKTFLKNISENKYADVKTQAIEYLLKRQKDPLTSAEIKKFLKKG